MENAIQESKEFLSKVGDLEGKVSSFDNERLTFQEKVSALTEERDEIQKDAASLKESSQSLEAEKQVRSMDFYENRNI